LLTINIIWKIITNIS